MKKHMTGPDVAKRLGVRPATIRSWRCQGKGPPYHQPAGQGTQATYDPDVVELFASTFKARRKKNGHPTE